MKIIIVDDNKSMRSVLRSLLESEGHSVIAELSDGSALLEQTTETKPDIICLDFNLPGLNGLELLEKLNVAANSVDVIMISGESDPELKALAADNGAAGFIKKPFSPQKIIDEINEIYKTRVIKEATETNETNINYLASFPESSTTVAARTAVVIDDSASIRALIRGILQEVGISVVGFAANGKTGIEIIEQTHPAFVCLDVDMPVMSGLDALPIIHANSPKSKIIMITGNSSREILDAAITGGAIGYFLKPIRPNRVEQFLTKLLQTSK